MGLNFFWKLFDWASLSATTQQGGLRIVIHEFLQEKFNPI
jgi:hypothetical protein